MRIHAEPRFRLLKTTRAYALAKLKERGELETLAQRHARYFLNLFDMRFERTDAEFDKASAALWLEINNLRAALGWAFSAGG